MEHSISCLPVLDENGSMMGIVTWKDILTFFVKNLNSL